MLIDAAESQHLLTIEKDARGAAAIWHEVVSPVSRVVLRKHLNLALAVTPPPRAGDLLVRGEWKSPSQIQIFLFLVHGTDQIKLARLCLTPRHGPKPHWHYLEDVMNQSVKPVSHPPATINEVTMFNDVFVPTMKITNVAAQLL